MNWLRENIKFWPEKRINLHFVSWTGDVQSLGMYEDVLQIARGGFTALHLAAMNGHIDTIRALKEMGGDLSVKCDNHGTPMHWAARREILKVLQEMQGTKIKEPPTPISDVEGQELLDAIKVWSDMEALGRKGRQRPIHCATRYGDLDAVKLLLELGEDISALDCNSNTAMHYAAAGGYLDIVKELKETGASISARNYRGSTPIHRAARFGSVHVIEALKEMGADILAEGYGGATILHYAVAGNQSRTLRMLKNMGADVSAKDVEGETPGHWAAHYAYVDVIEALKEIGADFSAKDHGGWTPMHAAATHGHVGVIKVLGNLVGPSSLFDKGDSERIPGYWQVPPEEAYTYDVLKKLGSPVSTRIGKDQWTPKLWASRNNRFEAAKLLMEMEMEMKTEP